MPASSALQGSSCGCPATSWSATYAPRASGGLRRRGVCGRGAKQSGVAEAMARARGGLIPTAWTTGAIVVRCGVCAVCGAWPFRCPVTQHRRLLLGPSHRRNFAPACRTCAASARAAERRQCLTSNWLAVAGHPSRCRRLPSASTCSRASPPPAVDDHVPAVASKRLVWARAAWQVHRGSHGRKWVGGERLPQHVATPGWMHVTRLCYLPRPDAAPAAQNRDPRRAPP